MAKFQGVDYYDIDSLLTEEQRMIRDTVREWVDDNLLPVINEAYIGRYLPKQLVPGMAELGMFGANLPEEYGCAGLDNVSYGLIMQELERGDSGIRSFASVQGALCMYPIYAFGSEEQKREYLPRMATGEVIGCFGLTEPDFGSNPGGMVTRARKTDDGWVLNGAKMWITNGSTANIAIIWAKTGELDDTKSIRGFIVPTDTPGYVVARLEDKVGQHSSDTAQINFDDCRIPAENLIGEEGEGYRIALSALEGGRIGIAAQSVGMARSAFDVAVAYAKERQSFGTAIFNHQAVGFRLADCATELEAARQLIWHAASLRDAGLPCLKEAAMAKLFASEMAERVCSAAIQTLGGYGYVNDFPVERIWRDVRVCQIYEGTSDVQKIIIQRGL